MLTWWRRFRREQTGHKAFRALPRKRRRLVFYSEGGGYWSHFEPVFRALRDEHGEEVVYVTSGENDPVLLDPPDGLTPFYVGSGTIRTLFFAGLEADVLLMTMPDLQTYHIKRSPYGVHYVYLHHSIVSTHMIYRPAAFDHFDTIFCVGPHHVAETRAREQQLGLPVKHLVEHGYGRLDRIMAEAADARPASAADGAPRILVAPSWGDNALLETGGQALVQALLAAGFQVTVRPHPQTRRHRPEVLDALVDACRANPRFVYEENIDSRDSLLAADLMISDWSGAALEFAFGLERPVLFIDVPRKVNNPEYAKLGIEPLEAAVRGELGTIAPAGRPAAAVAAAEDLLKKPDVMREQIRLARERHVFNPGCSGAVGARALVALLGR